MGSPYAADLVKNYYKRIKILTRLDIYRWDNLHLSLEKSITDSLFLYMEKGILDETKLHK